MSDLTTTTPEPTPPNPQIQEKISSIDRKMAKLRLQRERMLNPLWPALVDSRRALRNTRLALVVLDQPERVKMIDEAIELVHKAVLGLGSHPAGEPTSIIGQDQLVMFLEVTP